MILSKSDWQHLDFLFGHDENEMMNFLRELGYSFDNDLDADKIACDLIRQGYITEPDPFFEPLHKITDVAARSEFYLGEIRRAKDSLSRAIDHCKKLRDMIDQLSLISD